MKRKKYYLAIFLSAFVMALIAQAPASVLGTWLVRASGGRVVLAEPHGTIWNGTATPVIQLKAAAPLRLGTVAWNVSLRPLWHGYVLLSVRQVGAAHAKPSEIWVRPGQTEFRNFALDLPAAAMGGLNPLLQAMRLQGRLAISANGIAIGHDGEVTGTATANWEMAGSTLSPINPFGSYRLELAGEGDKIKINLSTVSGCLQLNGHGQWLGDALEFEATANATGKSKDALSEMLHHLGPETAPGVFSLKISR